MSEKTKKSLIIQSSSNESEEMLSVDVDNDLKSQYEKIGDCDDENYYSNECNKFLLKKEFTESKYMEENPYSDIELYPNLSDINFNIKIM